MTLKDYLTYAVQEGASDIFIVPGAPVSIKTDGQIKHIDEEKVMPSLAEGLITELYALSERDMQGFQQTGDDDFSFALPGLARFRVNTYRQRGSFAAVIRIVNFEIPDWQELHIPEEVMRLSDSKIVRPPLRGDGNALFLPLFP